MRRRVISFLVCLSLLLCLLSQAALVRGRFHHAEAVEWTRRDDRRQSFRKIWITSGRGHVSVETFWQDNPTMPPADWPEYAARLGRPGLHVVVERDTDLATPRLLTHFDRGAYAAGFAWGRRQSNYPHTGFGGTVVAMPWWPLVVLTAIPPAAWFVNARRRRVRARRWMCWECGYDLRATPGTCPECGTPGSKSEIRSTKSETNSKHE